MGMQNSGERVNVDEEAVPAGDVSPYNGIGSCFTINGREPTFSFLDFFGRGDGCQIQNINN